MNPQLVSIVLPIYNEAAYIADVIGEYAAALTQLAVPYELVLVPNGCRDDSAAHLSFARPKRFICPCGRKRARSVGVGCGSWD